MRRKNLNEEDILNLYNKGQGVDKIAKELKVGKKRIYEFFRERNLDTSKTRSIIQSKYIISDWRIEKYTQEEGYHYIAKFKEDGKEFNDYMNLGGFLTSYIKEKLNIVIPTLYDRRKFYMETGNYWWEQWFDIIKIKDVPTKKCPYCDWVTKDINNKSGAFEIHLNKIHGKTKLEYLKEFPDDKEYFTLVNNTLNRQMSNNPDEYIICGICGKKLARIDGQHLKKHRITKKEYIEKFGATTSKLYHEKQSAIAKELNINIKRSFTSKPEQEIIEWLINQGISNKQDRKLLKGKEIDIYRDERYNHYLRRLSE